MNQIKNYDFRPKDRSHAWDFKMPKNLDSLPILREPRIFFNYTTSSGSTVPSGNYAVVNKVIYIRLDVMIHN